MAFVDLKSRRCSGGVAGRKRENKERRRRREGKGKGKEEEEEAAAIMNSVD